MTYKLHLSEAYQRIAGARLLEFRDENGPPIGALCWGDWESDAPLALCIHGFPDEPGGYAEQARMLNDQGYRVLAPYLHGYYKPEETLDYCVGGGALTSAVALGYLRLLEDTQQQVALLIGHDWGAPVAYSMAVAGGERIQKLVGSAVPYAGALQLAFIADPAQQLRSWYMFLFQMEFAEMAVAHEDFAFIDRLWRNWSPGWNYNEHDIRAVKDIFTPPQGLSAALSYYRLNLKAEPAGSSDALALRARTGSEPLTQPMLYIHGADDGCIGKEYAEQSSDVFAGGLTTEVIENAGHFVHREQPEAFNAALQAFINS